VRNQGTGTWPARRARLAPGATAISHGSRDFDYAMLDQRVTRLANGLRAKGVGHGDRIALLSPNHPAYLEMLFAAGLLGAVFVPLNARLTAAEIEYQCSDAGVSVLVHAAGLADVAARATSVTPDARRISLDDEYEALIAAAPATRIDETVTHSDICIVMYTSGTTARPKGVVLTHGNMLMAVMNAVLDLDLHSDENALVCAPLFHTGALNMVALPTLLKGGRAVIIDGFEPGHVLSVIESERITHLFGVPTMLDALSAHPSWQAADLSSVRRIVVAAAPVPLHTLRTFTDRGITMCQGYGLTESGPGALILTAENAERKIGSAGVPHFFTDVRIVTPTGEGARPGERGEIQISGPNVMSGYWHRTDASAEALTPDGWLHSGDVGVADEEGFITIVDRLKDMIITGGENVYPAEVEAELIEMPEVTGCAVFGVADPKWGETPCAAVTLAEGAQVDRERVAAFLAPRLARYKIPKAVHVVDEIPRNATGKIRKHELRARFGAREY